MDQRKDLRGTINFLFVITVIMIIIIGLLEGFENQIKNSVNLGVLRQTVFYLWGVTFLYSLIMLALDYYDNSNKVSSQKTQMYREEEPVK